MKGDTKARLRKLARHYVENGKKDFPRSMMALEYGLQYIDLGSKDLLATERMQKFIEEEQEKYDYENSYNRDRAVILLNDLKKDCETAADRTNMLGVIKELDRIHQLYGNEDGGITINQLIVSPEERKKVLSEELRLLEEIDNSPMCIAE